MEISDHLCNFRKHATTTLVTLLPVLQMSKIGWFDADAIIFNASVMTSSVIGYSPCSMMSLTDLPTWKTWIFSSSKNVMTDSSRILGESTTTNFNCKDLRNYQARGGIRYEIYVRWHEIRYLPRNWWSLARLNDRFHSLLWKSLSVGIVASCLISVRNRYVTV